MRRTHVLLVLAFLALVIARMTCVCNATVEDLNSSILQVVTANPNGTLTAPKGALAIETTTPTVYQNTTGGTVWVVIIAAAPTGFLSISNAATAGTVNLSSVGTGQIDWLYQNDVTDSTRVYDPDNVDTHSKLTGGGILMYPGVDVFGGTGSFSIANGSTTFSSTNTDDVTLVALSSVHGFKSSGVAANDSGWRFVAPASTTQHVLRFYTSHFHSTIVCTAHLTDASAADVNFTSAANATTVQETGTVTFKSSETSAFVVVTCVVTSIGSGTPYFTWYAEVLSAS